MGMGTLVNLTLANLNKCFEYAREEDAKYIAILVTGVGEEPEVIINPAANFDAKQEYWNATYTNELVHKHSPAIRIIGFSQADSYDEVQALLGV
jgi:hypothetical protein